MWLATYNNICIKRLSFVFTLFVSLLFYFLANKSQSTKEYCFKQTWDDNVPAKLFPNVLFSSSSSSLKIKTKYEHNIETFLKLIFFNNCMLIMIDRTTAFFIYTVTKIHRVKHYSAIEKVWVSATSLLTNSTAIPGIIFDQFFLRCIPSPFVSGIQLWKSHITLDLARSNLEPRMYMRIR